jgi:hypothetical protein
MKVNLNDLVEDLKTLNRIPRLIIAGNLIKHLDKGLNGKEDTYLTILIDEIVKIRWNSYTSNELLMIKEKLEELVK